MYEFTLKIIFLHMHLSCKRLLTLTDSKLPAQGMKAIKVAAYEHHHAVRLFFLTLD